ncbi:hypothetical protein ABZ817_47155, partial [Streptomyces antimycoticus]|uniref:hypothetical protein n=1 Tax=Streptomyces antimycoticus TaxID=68175 RepID=UPI00340270A6
MQGLFAPHPSLVDATPYDRLTDVEVPHYLLPLPVPSTGQGGLSRRPSDLDVISFGESAVADEGAGDAGEGQEVLGFALIA